MASFILEIWDESSRQVTFYTIRQDGEESEMDKFLMRYRNNSQHGRALQQLVALLFEQIGDRFGAKPVFFTRKEGRARALPPQYAPIENIKFRYNKFPFRLYCLRISDSLVVLFDGGLKTAQTAQGSPDLANKFEDANFFAERIIHALDSQLITISPSGRELHDLDGNPNILFS